MVTIREPAMGPVFGVKGGAAGGGYSQVIPMEDINLHFTGDFHAITAANNLLAALIDNHLQQGNALGIDSRRITWRRCLDVNDRSLRDVIMGLGGPTEGVPRESGFDITPGLRDHGHLLPGRRPGRPAGAAGPHRGRLHARQRAGTRRPISTRRAR